MFHHFRQIDPNSCAINIKRVIQNMWEEPFSYVLIKLIKANIRKFTVKVLLTIFPSSSNFKTDLYDP